MFGISFTELILIAVIALLALGPKRLPAMMQTVGRAMRELRKATRELREAVGLDDLLNGPDPRVAPPPEGVDWREYPPEGPDADGALDETVVYAGAGSASDSPAATHDGPLTTPRP